MLFALETDEKLNREVLAARTDEAKLEALIRKNRRFILGCAYKTTHRFITESDDEWSVALIAFHEAVQAYESGKGNFKSFAALVIKRRLLDNIDREARSKNEISADLSGAETEDGEPAPSVLLEAQRCISEESMRRAEETGSVKDEIDAVGQTLRGYGFSFFDLPEASPKAQKTKDACGRVIRALMADEAMMAQLRRTGTLPAKQLCVTAGVPRKILENHRKYIIAAAEILNGDYPQLAEYLRFVKRGETE